MKQRIFTNNIFKMVEGPMLLKPREFADYVCDEVGSDNYLTKEGSRGNTNRENNFYAVSHCYRRSKRLRRAIKSRLTTLLKNYSQQITYRWQAEVSRDAILIVESVHLFLFRG